MKAAGQFFGFLLMVAYLPGTFQPATAGRWAVASIGIAVLLWCLPRIPILQYGLAFLAIAELSLVWETYRLDGANEMWRYLLVAGAIALGLKGMGNAIFEGAAWGIAVSTPFVIAQMFGYHPVLEAAPPAGLFSHKDMLAETAMLVVLWALWHRRWVLLGLCLPCVIFPHDRAVFVALLGAGVVLLWPRRRMMAYGLAGISALALVGATTLQYRHQAIDERLDIWRDTILGMTLQGRGIGQYYGTYPEAAKYEKVESVRPAHAHNDLLEVAYELGIPGFLFAAVFAAGAFLSPYSWEKIVFTAFAIDSVFAFPLHDPSAGILGGVVAGGLYAMRSLLRDRLRLGAIFLARRDEGLPGHARGGAGGARLAARPGVPAGHRDMGDRDAKSGGRRLARA